MRYYQYCPDCKIGSIETVGKELKINRIGTDGYGQPVKYIDCTCGGTNMGFLYLDSYLKRKDKVDENLIQYLRHRIKFYIK